MNKRYWLNWVCFAFIGLLWATSPSHDVIYPIIMLCNVPLMALTFREKNLGFKLWRWVGRKCGWYVDYQVECKQAEDYNPIPAYDPEMWTETKVGNVHVATLPPAMGNPCEWCGTQIRPIKAGSEMG